MVKYQNTYSALILEDIVQIKHLRHTADELELSILKELEEYKSDEPEEAQMLLNELKGA